MQTPSHQERLGVGFGRTQSTSKATSLRCHSCNLKRDVEAISRRDVEAPRDTGAVFMHNAREIYHRLVDTDFETNRKMPYRRTSNPPWQRPRHVTGTSGKTLILPFVSLDVLPFIRIDESNPSGRHRGSESFHKRRWLPHVIGRGSRCSLRILTVRSMCDQNRMDNTLKTSKGEMNR